MTKILALNPPFMNKFSRQSRSPCVAKGGTFYYPYFLAYMTGALEKAGFEVKLVDAVAKEWSIKDVANFSKEYKPDLVVIDTSTPSIHSDVKTVEGIKKALPNAFVILVGTHPTYLPKETLEMSKKIDAVAVGEYDYTIRVLAKALENGNDLKKVDGIVFRKGAKIIKNKPRERIKNLDELPFVSQVYKKHLNIKDYFYASVRYPEVTILTARGCPWNCTFCNSPFKASYRPRSIENVVDEFLWIQKNLPEVKEVMIEDETFPAVKKRTIELCKLMKKRGVKLRWSCNARVDTDMETMKAMKDAGCRLMCVGFESPEQKVLDNIQKKTTKNMQLRFMRDTRKAGLLVNGCFILGLPGETKETIRKTIEFAKELNADTSQFYPIMVYPGTAAYEWAKKNKYLSTENYEKWVTKEGLHTTTVSRPELSDKELVELCDKARKEYYIRTKYIIGKIIQSLNPYEFLRTLKSLRIFLKYLRKKSA